MKKSLLFLGMAAVMMASCSNEDYLGENHGSAALGNGGQIVFTGQPTNITRATTLAGKAAAEKLTYKFDVVGTKQVGAGTGDTKSVFAQADYNDYGIAQNKTYKVWYIDGTSGNSISNSTGWEYVANAGTHGTSGFEATTTANQTVKYWDYAASQYDFVAYSATVGAPVIENIRTVNADKGFTFKGTAAELAGLYLAKSVTVPHSSKYNNEEPVKFEFSSGGSKVRLGIYETVPGYSVQNLKFRYTSGESTTNVILDGNFVGTPDTDVPYFVRYDGSNEPTVTIAETAANTTTYNFGTWAAANTNLATSSTAPTWAGGTAAYIPVFPNTVDANVGNMILKVDYELHGEDGSSEVIYVKGATAVVPKVYMTWARNHAYTYLFKISYSTNGTTGTEGVDPAGLYPITFDAVVEDFEDDEHQGIIATTNVPTIITYQDGSVSESGITYSSSDKQIYVQVVKDGNPQNLVAGTNIAFFLVPDGTTEADCMLGVKDCTWTTTNNMSSFGIDATDVTIGTATLKGNTYAYFSPSSIIDGKDLAVMYTEGGVSYYKIISK